MSLETAAYVRPPTTGNDNDVAVSTTSSAAIAHNCKDSEEWITITCAVAFNIKFGTSALADPSAVYPYPAGSYSFSPKAKDTHFKIRGSAAGDSKWWRSS